MQPERRHLGLVPNPREAMTEQAGSNHDVIPNRRQGPRRVTQETDELRRLRFSVGAVVRSCEVLYPAADRVVHHQLPGSTPRSNACTHGLVTTSRA